VTPIVYCMYNTSEVERLNQGPMLLRIEKIAEYQSFLEDFVDILKVCSDSKGTVTGSSPPSTFLPGCILVRPQAQIHSDIYGYFILNT
jgi:hypothetical protein